MKIEDLHRDVITGFLKRHGVADKTHIEQITAGFDLGKPVYERRIEDGDTLFQFMRNPDSTTPHWQTGRWFCLRGAGMNALGIFGGGSGRTLAEFTVNRPVWSLEGTAGPLARDWGWAGGGTGGATQIFVPPDGLMALVGKGHHIGDQ